MYFLCLCLRANPALYGLVSFRLICPVLLNYKEMEIYFGTLNKFHVLTRIASRYAEMFFSFLGKYRNKGAFSQKNVCNTQWMRPVYFRTL